MGSHSWSQYCRVASSEFVHMHQHSGPSIENAGFRDRLYGAFNSEYGWAITHLRKIHIASEPEMIDGKWIYKLIAVFDTFIAILST